MARRRRNLGGTQKTSTAARVTVLGGVLVVGLGGYLYFQRAESSPDPRAERRKRMGQVVGVMSAFSAVTSGYHGFKRNRSVGWGAAWFVMGALLPVVTPLIAVDQGFAKASGAKGDEGMGWAAAAGTLAVGAGVWYFTRRPAAPALEAPAPPAPPPPGAQLG